MPRKRWSAGLIALTVATSGLLQPSADAAQVIQFGGNSHGLTGAAAGQVVSGDIQMSLAAEPAGAVFNENSASSLGIDSRGVPAAIDVGERYGPDKINLLGGRPTTGGSEAVRFSFNRGGVLTGLRFDGVKDETLEYFQLTLPDGSVRTFYDFEVELRLTQQGFSLADLTTPGVTLLDGDNDNVTGLMIPFLPGEQFVLSYGEFPYPPGYVPLTPNQPPNGARWEGVTLAPEPAADCQVFTAAIAARVTRRRSKRTAS